MRPSLAQRRRRPSLGHVPQAARHAHDERHQGGHEEAQRPVQREAGKEVGGCGGRSQSCLLAEKGVLLIRLSSLVKAAAPLLAPFRRSCRPAPTRTMEQYLSNRTAADSRRERQAMIAKMTSEDLSKVWTEGVRAGVHQYSLGYEFKTDLLCYFGGLHAYLSSGATHFKCDVCVHISITLCLVCAAPLISCMV